MATQINIFVSSKMQELAPERQAIFDLIPNLDYGDIKFNAWGFEKDAPASENSIREEYLNALKGAALYLGIFWNQYGEWTIDEFERATELGKPRHIYVKDVESNLRDPRLQAFLDSQSDVQNGITSHWFKTLEELQDAVRSSIQRWVSDTLLGGFNLPRAILIEEPLQVPEQPLKLIGRTETVQNIHQLLANHRPVLLQGFAGVGKTAIAAHVVAERLNLHAGTAVWLHAGHQSAETICEALLNTLDKRGNLANVRNGDKFALTREILLGSNIRLVMMDDIWNSRALYQMTKIIPNNIDLLITSRLRHPIEQMLEISDLHPKPAIELLAYHADQDYTQDEDAELLCKLLGYLPFAIEIAGKLLRIRRWQTSELLHQVISAPHELKLPLNFAQEGRESVADLLEISLKELDEKSRKLFFIFGQLFAPRVTPQLLSLIDFRMSVSAGYFPEQLAEMRDKAPAAMTEKEFWHTLQWVHLGEMVDSLNYDLPPFDIEPELNKLQDFGLIEHVVEKEISYYRIHSLAFTYVKAQTTLEHYHRTIDACRIYFNRHEKYYAQHEKALLAELDNLLEAIRWSLDLQRFVGAHSLIFSLANNERLHRQGFLHQITQIIHQAVQISDMYGQMRNKVDYLTLLGIIYEQYLGNNLAALVYFQQTLEISQAIQYKYGEANASNHLGGAHMKNDLPKLAKVMFRQAIKLFDELGDEKSKGGAVGNLAAAHLKMENYGDFFEFSTQAIAIHRKYGDKQAQAADLMNLGIAHQELAEYEQAEAMHQQALELQRQLDNPMGILLVLINIGTLFREQENYTQSLDWYEQAKNLCENLDWQYHLNEINQQITEIQSLKDQSGSI